MKTQRLTIEIMGPDKSGNGGVNEIGNYFREEILDAPFDQILAIGG